jgi:hypothetical protein
MVVEMKATRLRAQPKPRRMPTNVTSQANANQLQQSTGGYYAFAQVLSNPEFRRAADCELPLVPQFVRRLAGVVCQRRPLGSLLPTLLLPAQLVSSLHFFLVCWLILKFIHRHTLIIHEKNVFNRSYYFVYATFSVLLTNYFYSKFQQYESMLLEVSRGNKENE